MKIPVSYSFRNLWTRRLTTVLTAGGLALVVFVYATVLMMSEGLRKTLVQTGSYDNVVVIRKGAGAEVQSGVERDQAAIVQSLPGIATEINGSAAASKELVVLITLTKRSTGVATNVVIRGVGEQGIRLRPQVKIIEGRIFRPGSSEIVAGRSIAERFPEATLGGTIRFAQREWTIVGLFDAGKTGFDSEVWGDVDQLMHSFRRPVYSSVLLKLADPTAFESIKARIEADPRLKLEAKRESVFYAEQSEMLANFINYLGLALSIIFSIGAMLGAMITMYAAVANRTREIGTLRALGFRKGSILLTFLFESALLSVIGGAAGLILASGMQFLTISTLNWQTFAELAFTFTLTPAIVVQSLAFALIMGVLGGVLPAARAARMGIVDALRAA
jgi:putative ABC transport system permease protein